jgi:hypothetical protein
MRFSRNLDLTPQTTARIWASSRIKLNQLSYQHKLNPPADLIESASFLVMLTFMRQRPAVGFVARSELPPVGLIMMRGRTRPPATAQLIECLRSAAKIRRPMVP